MLAAMRIDALGVLGRRRRRRRSAEKARLLYGLFVVHREAVWQELPAQKMPTFKPTARGRRRGAKPGNIFV
jgi:hypothetical protein